MKTAHTTAPTLKSKIIKTQPSSSPVPDALPDGDAIMQNRIRLLGSLLHLAMQSPLHRQYTLDELEEQFVSSLLHDQFRYYEVAGSPHVFAKGTPAKALRITPEGEFKGVSNYLL